MRHLVLPLSLGLILTGCQMIPLPSKPQREAPPEVVERDGGTQPPTTAPADSGRVERKTEFPEAEYAALAKTGTAAISGRLTLETANGTVAGSGETVSVAPITSYSAEAAAQALAGRAVERADPRARAYTHTTRTDGNGYFVLRNLPAGDFYVSGSLVDPSTGERRIVIHETRLGAGQRREINLRR